jgi:multidrug efflux pump
VRLPQFFIDRPIFAAVISIMIVLVGVIAMYRLPIAEYPEVVPPTIVISATYPGANPETIAQTVAAPLEQQMTGIDGMLYVYSQSNNDGTMALTLTFNIGTDLDKALLEVQNRIQRAQPRLPLDVTRLGVFAQRRSPSLLMVVHLISRDGKTDTLTLANYARLYIRDRLASIPGVGDALVYGSGEYAMRVWLDPVRMAARGLTPADVEAAIQAQNLQIAPGALGSQPVSAPTAFQFSITTKGRLTSADEFADIIVHRGDNGQLVRVRDVGRVELGANTYSLRSLLSINDPPDNFLNLDAAAIPIIQAPGSNALAVSQAVRAKMKELQQSFPAGVDYQIVYDPTIFVSDSIKEVEKTLAEALVLVVIVVLLFLQTWRASIIPLLAVPVSLIGTFAVMDAFGFSINNLSLFGLVLSIGIVVDDAIVVVENVERNLAGGGSARAATKQAMREVSGPILATALVLSSVFIPTAFASGLTGRFYQQFALTIAISTVISAFNSLTMSPALAALLLKPHAHDRRPGGFLFGWFFAGFNWCFRTAADIYVGIVKVLVHWAVAPFALMIYAALLALTVWFFASTPTSFIPGQDKGYLIAFCKLPDGASLDRTDAVIRKMSEIALENPAVDGAVAFPGLSFNGFCNSSNTGIVFVRLKDFDKRTGPHSSAHEVKDAIQQRFFAIDDALVLAIEPPAVFGLGAAGGFKLFIEDQKNEGLPALFQQANQALGAMHMARTPDGRPVFDPFGTFTFFTMGVPRVAVDIDSTKAVARGVNLSDINDALQGYFGTAYVNDFNRFGRTWQVDVQADAQFRRANTDFDVIKTHGPGGTMVPLSEFVHLRDIAGPESAMQYNTFPAIDISSGAAPGISPDEAQVTAGKLLDGMGIKYEWTDVTKQQQLAGNTTIYIFPMCVLLVILVLAAFYESLTLPLAIVLIVPMCLLSALFGVRNAPFLFHVGAQDDNIMTQIGLIVLVGLACKNAILIVEFAKEAEILKGMKPIAAALDACRLRLRPILMTSMAFIMGVWPLVVAHGAGAELRQATGIAVFSGMIGVTFFGLMLTPVFYVTLRWLSGSRPLKGHTDDGEIVTSH